MSDFNQTPKGEVKKKKTNTTSCPKHTRLWRKFYDLRFPLKSIAEWISETKLSLNGRTIDVKREDWSFRWAISLPKLHHDDIMVWTDGNFSVEMEGERAL